MTKTQWAPGGEADPSVFGVFTFRIVHFAYTVVVRIKLELLDSAATLQDLTLPVLRLEKLKGDRKGQHSIRINDVYRISFAWKDDGARDVAITDYH